MCHYGKCATMNFVWRHPCSGTTSSYVTDKQQIKVKRATQCMCNANHLNRPKAKSVSFVDVRYITSRVDKSRVDKSKSVELLVTALD